MMQIRIDDIKIGNRFRKNLGDIQGLADSIKEQGLLQPVGINENNELIFGQRRIEAAKLLGWDSIDVRVVNVTSIIEGELAENDVRKNFDVDERVAIGMAVEDMLGERWGGDRKSDEFQGANIGALKNKDTRDIAAEKAGFGSHGTYEKAKVISEKATPEQKEKLNKGESTINKVFSDIKKEERKELNKQNQIDALNNTDKKNSFIITKNQDVIQCDVLITDPPYKILNQNWEPDDIEKFTRDWAGRWNECNADFIIVFFSQRYMWDGRKWFDESFSNYNFQQLLIWHYPNNKSPQSKQGFKQTYEPIFFYRRRNSIRQVNVCGHEWGNDLNDFDCHVAAVPQSNFNNVNMKEHPAQKPLSVMRWLVNSLSNINELIVDPFCGSGTTGVAALQLNRRFYGIEINDGYIEIANQRIACYG